MEKIYEFLKDCGTYFIASVDENGKPRVRPFGTVDIFEGGLYIQTGRKKACYKQIAANPWIELCAFKDGRWVRLSAKAVEDNRVEAKKHMLDAYPNLRNMYDENDGNTVVFKLTEATATISSFTAASEEYKW